PVQRLEGPGHVGRNPGVETGVRIAVRIDGLHPVLEPAHGELAQNAQTLIVTAGVDEIRTVIQTVRRPWFLSHDPDGVDIVVAVEARIRTSGAPVPVIDAAVNAAQSAERIFPGGVPPDRFEGSS